MTTPQTLKPIVVLTSCRETELTLANYLSCENATLSSSLEWTGIDLWVDLALIRLIEVTEQQNPRGDSLLVADTGNHCIVTIDL